jgi:putative Ca2+/H+ antiporter (TMEM165/GDT1 family)
MLYLMAATYSTVLFAEMLGDKSIYTISSLSARFNSLHVLGGVSLAFACKMLVAVLIGRTIFAALPPGLIAWLSAASFFTTGLFLLLKRSKEGADAARPRRYWSSAILISFAAIFFSEWGDVGQLAAANMAARYDAPVTVLVGGTGALLTKGVVAATIGIGVRKRIGTDALRYAACGLCMLIGFLSLFLR